MTYLLHLLDTSRTTTKAEYSSFIFRLFDCFGKYSATASKFNSNIHVVGERDKTNLKRRNKVLVLDSVDQSYLPHNFHESGHYCTNKC